MLAITRGVNSNNPTLVTIFSNYVVKAFQQADIYDQIHSLGQKENLTPTGHDDLEQLDIKLTQILIVVDKKCKKSGSHPWSPDLHQAYLIHHYWTLKLSSKQTGRQYPQAFKKLRIRSMLSYYKHHPPTRYLQISMQHRNN